MEGPQRDTLEFASGVALGIALGVATVSVLIPEPSAGTRFRRRLRRPRRRLGKRAGEARAAAGMGLHRSGRLARELGTFAREVAAATREELLAGILRQVRSHEVVTRPFRSPRRLRTIRERLPPPGKG
jgi:hypothetical protein